MSVEWAFLVFMFLVTERTENVSQICIRSSRAFMHSDAGCILHKDAWQGVHVGAKIQPALLTKPGIQLCQPKGGTHFKNRFF